MNAAQIKDNESMSQSLQYALGAAKDGSRVFPLRHNSKLPAIKAWQVQASRDPKTIKRWALKFPNCNWGIAAGERIVDGVTRHVAIIDLDVQKDVDGIANFQELAATHGGVPATTTVNTPRKGQHLYLCTSRPVGTNASGIAPGVDVRGVGGYVVCPGSVIDGKAYTLANDCEPANCPAWLEALLPHPGAKPAEGSSREPLPGIDPERAAARAVEYLTKHAPEAIDGAGGDHTTFVVAAKLKDLGVDEATAVRLMLELWHDGCGWSPDELAVKVRNAFKYGANPPGIDAPEAAFDVVPETEAEPRKARYRFASVSDLLSRPRPTWLVRGLLPARGLGVVYGAPGSGKSFLMLDLAAAIARGESWAGQRVRSGRVAHVSLEGAMRYRIEAYMQHHGIDLSHLAGLQVLERQDVNLLTDGERDARDLVEDIEAGGPVSLVVVDTLNRAMPGGNENASEDMGRAIRCAGLIASRLNCLVVFVHHSGKDSSAGARGHSSLLGAADAELEVSRQGADSPFRYVRATKVKDGEDGARFSFSLKTIDLGPTQAHDPDADPEERDTSCVVAELGKSEAPVGKTARNWTPLRQNVLGALRNLLSDRFAAPGEVATCSVTDWQQAYFDATPLPDHDDPKAARKDKDARRKNFTDARDWLVAEKLVTTAKKKGVLGYRLTGDF